MFGVEQATTYIFPSKAGREERAEFVWRLANTIVSKSIRRVVCVGTDRSTGDSFGPLVGWFLRESGTPLEVIGTVHEPIHAANLHTVTGLTGVLAVDASLGSLSRVGAVYLEEGPLTPGAGVNKVLGTIGDAHLCGTVNVAGLMECFVLQNTRLSVVMKMAQYTAEVIREAFTQAKSLMEAAAANAPATSV